MKSVVILVAALAVAGGVWWFTGGQDDAITSVVDDAATTESASDPDASPTVLIDEAGKSSDSDDVVTEAANTDDEESVAADTSTDEAATESSPFAVVESEEGQESAPSGDEVAQQPQLPAAEEITNASEVTQRSREPIQVPSSYPVTDAEKYFIPKEERGPGNLGGPPPLNFPGGPSDPNRDTNQGAFQPPPAPGQ